ncbi:MAG: hypothetical protein ACRELF_17150, partial [Gemmataceae bacterium]
MCIRGRSLWCLLVLLLSVGISQAKEPKQNKNVEITVEVKFVEVGQNVVEELKRQGLLEKESKGKEVPSLNTDEMICFLEAVQNDIHSNVMQAPKLTMLNGRTAVINP